MFDKPGVLGSYLASYAAYAVLAGLWFAYLAGARLWVGGLAGFGVALLLALPIGAIRQRGGRRKSARRPYDERFERQDPVRAPGPK